MKTSSRHTEIQNNVDVFTYLSLSSLAFSSSMAVLWCLLSRSWSSFFVMQYSSNGCVREGEKREKREKEVRSGEGGREEVDWEREGRREGQREGREGGIERGRERGRDRGRDMRERGRDRGREEGKR